MSSAAALVFCNNCDRRYSAQDLASHPSFRVVPDVENDPEACLLALIDCDCIPRAHGQRTLAVAAESCTVRSAPRLPVPSFTLNGERIDIDQFCRVNVDTFDASDLAAIDALGVGEEIVYGGGAFATSLLRRVA